MVTSWPVDTVNAAAVDVLPPNVAVMLLPPGATPVATPRLDTVAIVVLDDTHETEDVTFCVVPSEYCAVAVNCFVVPAAIVAVGGVTMTLVSVPDPTVSTAVPVTAPLVAVMVTLPGATGCARPVVAATVALVASEDDQVTKPVMSRVVLSENAPVAVN
jgi:hypothetical protein